MTTDELLNYALDKECAFIEAGARMKTKKGALKKSWLHEFWNYQDGDLRRVEPPKNGEYAGMQELWTFKGQEGRKFKLPTTGGSLEAGVSVRTPCGQTFCLMIFTKQPEIWLDYAAAVAEFKSLAFGRISERNLTINSGQIFALDTCQIDGYNLIPHLSDITK